MNKYERIELWSVRGVNGEESPYFQGRYKTYGLFNWKIKFYDWNSEFEVEQAQHYFLGEDFEVLHELLGRKVDVSIQGRSGGWLVIDEELSMKELKKVDAFVKRMLKTLPKFLKEERAYRKEEEENAAKEEQDTRSALMKDKRIQEVLKLLKEVSPSDFVLIVKGLNLTQKENL